jgi:hypothetical protein
MILVHSKSMKALIVVMAMVAWVNTASWNYLVKTTHWCVSQDDAALMAFEAGSPQVLTHPRVASKGTVQKLLAARLRSGRTIVRSRLPEMRYDFSAPLLHVFAEIPQVLTSDRLDEKGIFHPPRIS